MTNLEKAQAIVRDRPNDPNAEAEIEALEESAPDEDKFAFADIYEALLIAQGWTELVT